MPEKMGTDLLEALKWDETGFMYCEDNQTMISLVYAAVKVEVLAV